MAGNISKVPLKGTKGDIGDTPNIEFQYDEETGELSYTSDGILINEAYVKSKKFASIDYVDAKISDLKNLIYQKSLVKTVTINLLASNWVSDRDNQHSQIISIADITPYSKVDLQPTTEQLLIFHEKDIAFVTENYNGIVTVFCIGQKPTLDYVMQATITEVEANG